MIQPKTTANLTVLPRQVIDYLGRAIAVADADEGVSFNNFATVSRAINPTRRIAIDLGPRTAMIVTGKTEKADGKGRPLTDLKTDRELLTAQGLLTSGAKGDALADGRIALFAKTIKSLLPAESRALLAQVSAAEEDLMLRRFAEKRFDKDAEPLADDVKAEQVTEFIRFFRFQDIFMRDIPIGGVLDAALAGHAYDVTEPSAFRQVTAPAFFANHTSDLPDASTLEAADVLHELYGTNADNARISLIPRIILMEYLISYPKVMALMRSERTEIVDKDPKVRYNSVRFAARFLRFMALQPAMLYAVLMDEFLKNPVVREAITELHSEFYSSARYAAFTTRASSIRLGACSAHIATDVMPTTVVTRYGEHPLVRVPRLLKPFVAKLEDYLNLAAREGTVLGSDTVANLSSKVNTTPPLTTRLSALGAATEFMREFMLNTGTDDDWTQMVAMMGEMGFDRPAPAKPVDQLNPPLVVSDGWTASVPVDYHTATRSMAVTPLFMRSGSPEKVAVTTDLDVFENPSIVGKESPVSRVVLINQAITPGQARNFPSWGMLALDLPVDTKKSARPSAAFSEFRPVLWVVRRAEQNAFLGDEMRFSIKGRFPMAMYNGELDATPVQHTTFEAFAYDLGMAPSTLAKMVKGARLDVADAPSELKNEIPVWQFLAMFFTKRRAGNNASIFAGDDTYGLDADLGWAHPMYYVSARSTALMTGALLALAPMEASGGMKVHARDLLAMTSRTSRSFAVVVADRQDPLIHTGALRETCVMDRDFASIWGVSLM